jgi:hypothetical protein
MVRPRIAADFADLGPWATDLQQAKVLERSNAVKRKIDAWIEVQHLYLPSISIIRAQADENPGVRPSAVPNIKLHLPSAILDRVNIPQHLLEYEFHLRYAIAHTTLDAIRGLLLLRSHMWKSKDRFSRGQKQNSRSQMLLASVETRIKRNVKKYRDTRERLVNLSEPLLNFTWVQLLRELEDSDVAGLSFMDDEGSEGRKKLAWIWKVRGTGSSADESTQAGTPFVLI